MEKVKENRNYRAESEINRRSKSCTENLRKDEKTGEKFSTTKKKNSIIGQQRVVQITKQEKNGSERKKANLIQVEGKDQKMMEKDVKSNRRESTDSITLENGSQECPYRMVIIGGGPAGLSILLRSIRLGLFERFLEGGTRQKGDVRKTAGIAVIESNSRQKFGSGSLGNYVINSNTKVSHLVESILEDKKDAIPVESTKDTILESLKTHPKATSLTSEYENVGPLEKVGEFLNVVGDKLICHIENHALSDIFCDTKVIKLQQENQSTLNGWKITIATGKGIDEYCEKTIFAERVVLACGGKPKPVPNTLMTKLLSTDQANEKKIIHADTFLQQSGIEKVKYMLTDKDKSNSCDNNKSPSSKVVSSTTKEAKKITIIGASHSGFSSCWVALNKIPRELFNPYLTAKNEIDIFKESGNISNKDSISILHRSNVRVFFPTIKEAEESNIFSKEDIVNMGKNLGPKGQINTFSGLRGDAKELYLGLLKRDEVCYQDNNNNDNQYIKNKNKEFSNDPNGSQKESKTIKSSSQEVEVASNPINIVSTRTPNWVNVRLEKISHNEDEILQNIASSDVIIWACGYGSHISFPILNTKGQPIKVLIDNNHQVVIDETARIRTSLNNGFTIVSAHNLYGIGLGFGFNALRDTKGEEVKADGIGIYLKKAATTILSSILGSCVFGGCVSWEAREALLAQQRKRQRQKAAITASLARILQNKKDSSVSLMNKDGNRKKLHINTIDGKVLKNDKKRGGNENHESSHSRGLLSPTKKNISCATSRNSNEKISNGLRVSATSTSKNVALASRPSTSSVTEQVKSNAVIESTVLSKVTKQLNCSTLGMKTEKSTTTQGSTKSLFPLTSNSIGTNEHVNKKNLPVKVFHSPVTNTSNQLNQEKVTTTEKDKNINQIDSNISNTRENATKKQSSYLKEISRESEAKLLAVSNTNAGKKETMHLSAEENNSNNQQNDQKNTLSRRKSSAVKVQNLSKVSSSPFSGYIPVDSTISSSLKSTSKFSESNKEEKNKIKRKKSSLSLGNYKSTSMGSKLDKVQVSHKETGSVKEKGSKGKGKKKTGKRSSSTIESLAHSRSSSTTTSTSNCPSQFLASPCFLGSFPKDKSSLTKASSSSVQKEKLKSFFFDPNTQQNGERKFAKKAGKNIFCQDRDKKLENALINNTKSLPCVSVHLRCPNPANKLMNLPDEEANKKSGSRVIEQDANMECVPIESIVLPPVGG